MKNYIAIAGVGLIAVGAGVLGYKIYLNKRNDRATTFMAELDAAIEPTVSVERNFSTNCRGLPNSKRLTDSELELIAAKIKNAFGVFNDDEDAVYNAIRTVKSKEQFCQLSNKFLQLFDIALQDKLEADFSEEELQKVLTIIESKPEYIL